MNQEFIPTSPEAERALIGAVIERMEVTNRAARVKPEDFNDGVLKEIWTTILKLKDASQPLDLITICEACKGSDLESDINEIIYTLVGSAVPTSMHLDKYASIVEVTSAKRKLARAIPPIMTMLMGDGMNDPGAVFAEAIAEIQNAGEGFQFYEREQWTGAELVALEVKENPFLLDGLLIENGLNLIAGEFAAGKTFCALDLAIGAASGGMSWARTVKPSSVLYFGADNSRDNLVRRVRAMAEGRGIDTPHENLIFDLSPLDLSTSGGMGVIREAITEHEADIVIIDAVIRYLGSLDENAATDIGKLMAGFRDIANTTGTTFILIHHLRKLSGQLTKTKIADRIRGSGDFLGAVDSAVVISTKGEGSNIIRNVTHVKCREAEESDPLSFEIHEGEVGGLVLSFGLGDSVMAADTLVDVALGTLIGALKAEPGVTFSKVDLRDVLDQAGVELSSRTESKAFTYLKGLPDVQISKAGRFNNYQWKTLNE